MTEPSHHTAETVAFPAARPELCLDYANTLCWRGSPSPEESLHALPDLLGWLAETAQVPRAVTAATLSEVPAAQLFGEAVALRETIYRLVSAVAAGTEVPSDDLVALNGALERAPQRRRLVCDDGRFAWDAGPGAQDAPTLLAPVLWSAADLLVQGGEHRVRRCANEKCLWLFVDRSKAGTRRWCDMAACGNRAKSQRHYARVKAS